VRRDEAEAKAKEEEKALRATIAVSVEYLECIPIFYPGYMHM